MEPVKAASLYSPEKWRSLLRGLLRECSYLPDPIARSACHDQVIQRFRRYHSERRRIIRDEVDRSLKLGKEARWSLSVLRRANEGYLKPLESVLRFAYGRTGRRRIEMMNKLVEADAPKDTEAVQELVAGPAAYEDGWEAPTVITTLLNSQNNNPSVRQLSDRPYIRARRPPDSVKNAWGRKMPLCRRRNIRRRWYKSVLRALYPPLPDAELHVLNGLLSKDIDWKLPKKRFKQQQNSADAAFEDGKGDMLLKILTDGPPKDQTFSEYQNGRPHTITRRIMIRLWQRISYLVPRHHWDAAQQKHIFEWDTPKNSQTLALSVDKEKSQDIFGSLVTEDTQKADAHQKSEVEVSL
ncbi:hypothetical protein BDV18DRAFT_163245 [Aspergillus unguis]